MKVCGLWITFLRRPCERSTVSMSMRHGSSACNSRRLGWREGAQAPLCLRMDSSLPTTTAPGRVSPSYRPPKTTSSRMDFWPTPMTKNASANLNSFLF